jgi:hypothetical protein
MLSDMWLLEYMHGALILKITVTCIHSTCWGLERLSAHRYHIILTPACSAARPRTFVPAVSLFPAVSLVLASVAALAALVLAAAPEAAGAAAGTPFGC